MCAERGDDHGHEAQAPSRRRRSAARSAANAADPGGLEHAIEAVDGDDDVGGVRRDRRAGRGERDADIGGGERGRVVDAVADHHDRPRARSVAERAHASTFASGACIGETSSTPACASDGVGGRPIVAADHHDPADAEPAQPAHTPGARRRIRVGHHDDPRGRPSIPTRTARGRAAGSAARRRRDGRRCHSAFVQPRRRADDDLAAVDAAGHAFAGALLDAGRRGRREARAPGGHDERLGEDVGRHLVHRGGEPQDAVSRRCRRAPGCARPRACRRSASRSCRTRRFARGRAARARCRP